MRVLNRTLIRLRNLATNHRGDRRLREEIDQHLALEVEENLRAGMSPQEARRQAILKFGAVEPLRESYHAEEGLPFIETLLADLRYALRMLRKSPGFTLVAIATLALGIGANAAIFTLLNAIMLRNLPVADPKSLVRLGNQNDCCVGIGYHDNGDYSVFTTASYQFFRNNLSEFSDLAAMQAGFAYRPVAARRDGSQEPARAVMGEFVSGNYFRTFGLAAPSGRLLADRDDIAGAPFTAVMSYQTWKTVYLGDPSIIGSTFRINTKPVIIVGIAPQGFYGDRMVQAPPELYLPIESMPAIANVTYVHNSEMQWLYLIGRIKPGVDRAQLQRKVSALLRQQLAPTPHYSSQEEKARLLKMHVVLTPGGGGITAPEEYSNHLLLLMCASGLVLLIACANIANLLLVRGVARKTEMSVRTALGAARTRIVRQLLTESLLLSLLGGLAGLAVAYGGTRMLLALAFPGARNIPINASPSLQVLAFAFGLSLITGILFGVAPAWMASRAEPADALRSGARSTAGGASILQRSLVVLQAALSLVLLVGAGLFAQSLSKLQHINLRLDARNRYIVHIDPQTAGYLPSQVGDLYRTVVDRFHAIPGVDKVGISSYTPMEDDNDQWSVMIQGKPDPHKSASVIRVSPEYFDSVGTRVLAGRNIGPQDTPSAATVAVVNQTFVKDFFKPGENPIGQRFGGGPKTVNDYQIVGVVDDTAYTDARDDDHRMFFTALLQREASDKDPVDKDTSLYSKAIVVATGRPVPDMEELARKTLSGINPSLSIVKFQTFAAQIHDQFTDDRLLARLTMLFGALALLLAALGLYGVTSYTVVRRAPEIGIRMALGAEKASVIRMVLRGAMLQALIGLVLGAPIAFLCIRVIKSQLYGITSVGVGVMAGAIAVLLAAAAIAGAIPARRAASINPAQTLRTE